MALGGGDDGGEVDALRGELDQLIHRMSHDFRAPLRQSRQLASWARQDWASGETAEITAHLEMLDGRLAHMQRMLDALLELGRLSHPEPTSRPVPLDALINDVLMGLCVPEHVTISVPEHPVTIGASPKSLSRVLELLLHNSLQHGGEQLEQIDIRVEGEEQLAFEVRDDGAGYEAHARRRAFELFFTTRPGSDFVGAGLTLAERMVNRVGSTLLIGDPDRGAVMAFQWPATVSLGPSHGSRCSVEPEGAE